MPHKYYHVWIFYDIRMENEEGEKILDDVTWKLLMAIRDHRSLGKAARELGISYRKAWGDLKKTEKLLGFGMTEKHRGGSRGGETLLSAEGQRFVDAYELFLKEFQEAVDLPITRLKRFLKEKETET